MLTNVTFCVILTIFSTISQAFFIQNHHKYSKYHRKNIRTQTLLYPHQIDIRGTFSDNSFGVSQEIRKQNIQSPSLHQCNFGPEDFTDSKRLKNAYCTWNNEFIIRRNNQEQFWCIGYLPENSQMKTKKTGVLSLKFDRSYQVGYSPGGIKSEKSSNLGIKLFLELKSLNTIIVQRAFDGLPEIIEVEFQGKKICKGNKIKKPPKQESIDDISSEEKNFQTASIVDKLMPVLSGFTDNGLTMRQEFQRDPISLPERPISLDKLKSDDFLMPPSQPQPQKTYNKFQSCGKRQLYHSELISNGQAAKAGDWPFHATIFHTSIRTFQYKCGGTVISNSLILTAAHCILENGNQIIPERVKVHLGRGNLGNFDMNSQEFEVFEIMCHEEFNRGTVRHDIALLKLATSIAFTTFIQPACLPELEFSIVNQIGIVIGFGRTESGQLSPVLREARMQVPSTIDCLESDRDFYGLFLYDGNYCAGHLQGKAVACTGDSGGGMYFNVNGAWTVRGIVSIGMKNDNEEGCSPDNYVLYTDIYKHMTWIIEKM